MQRQIDQTLGPIDIAVANAGGSFTMPAPIEEFPEDGWRASVEGNLTATFRTIESVLPGMKARKAGNIITISSAAGADRSPTRQSRTRLQKRGSRCSPRMLRLKRPLWHSRELYRAGNHLDRSQSGAHSPLQQSQLVEMHPIRHLGLPEDVAPPRSFSPQTRVPGSPG
jgi:3-oxoacyl-[acyl-carrier protein] reductase